MGLDRLDAQVQRRGDLGVRPSAGHQAQDLGLPLGGLWALVTLLGAFDLAGQGHPAHGLGQLAPLLDGFALAVAALLTVAERS